MRNDPVDLVEENRNVFQCVCGEARQRNRGVGGNDTLKQNFFLRSDQLSLKAILGKRKNNCQMRHQCRSLQAVTKKNGI